MHVMKLIFALCMMGLAPHAFAASFDCSKATSPTEKLICSDAETSALDSKLQQAYKTALKATDAYGMKALAKEQRNWITYTRGICQDTTCLRQAYEARIAVLARNEKNILNDNLDNCIKPSSKPQDNGCLNVVIYRDPNERIGLLNQSLEQQKQSGKIIGCSSLIDLPLGTVGGENTFGATCVLQVGSQRKDVEICYGDMGGAFQMQPASPQDVSNKHLIDFTYTQCYAPPAAS